MKPAAWANQSREFLGEVQGEFKKVTWPTERETVAGTISVVVVVGIIAVVLGLVDYALSAIMTSILP